MKENEKEIVRFVEPVLRFCLSRISNRADAEDLAGEIMLHVVNGVRKYEITALDAWVWRIAHNRYARFLEAKKGVLDTCSDEYALNLVGDYDVVDEENDENFEAVFRCLHTLSREYKDILVDYYIGELSVRALAEKYHLSETAVKWRLHVSREKIRNRIGEKTMDKVYTRLNWNTNTCNGNLNPNKYLHSQVARAICEAAYEKPLTIEEISMKTGLPTMYIEDALPNLIYGDAITELGTKYATNFIILREKDRTEMEKNFAPLIDALADYFESLFTEVREKVAAMDFYGHERGMEKLGYIALPMTLRAKIYRIKEKTGLATGVYPPRRDGGHGWFIVEETENEADMPLPFSTGCNVTDGAGGCIYWYTIFKYFSNNIYHNGGTYWLSQNNIVQRCENGVIPEEALNEDDIVRLLRANLIKKECGAYKLNFPCFTGTQFDEFAKNFRKDSEKLDALLADLILSVRKSFVRFTPKRLESQINQWVSCFVQRIGAYVTEELIARGVLETPHDEIPMTNGVFFVEGKYRPI